MTNSASLIINRIEQTKEQEGNSFWTISREVGELLSDIIKKNKFKSALEIGASIGYSTLIIGNALTKNKGVLTTIESSPKRIPILEENIKDSRLTNIVLIKGHAPEVLNQHTKTRYDFVFLDATKYEYIIYIKYLMNGWLKTGAFIIADNIDSHNKELQEYISFVKNNRKIKTQHISLGSGLLISQYSEYITPTQ